MTAQRTSLSLVVPAALQDKANRLACALGYDHGPLPGATFGVALSADGQEPATHYGCHAWAAQSFLDLLAAARAGAWPPCDWAAAGLTQADGGAAIEQMLSREAADGASPPENFAALLAGLGLQAIVPAGQ